MVTSNKLPDKKIVKMAEQNNSVVVPQRTLLGEVNEHITCPLCRGYYIDATTIVECLHSFCRSCIIKHLQVKSYCPVCEMMINSAKPNIKLDKALQDIVYKLVPGLFQKEMERRQQFYASRPGPAASATPEQRGEDTERIIFSPEDVISFSLEYADVTDTDSISSKSSDSNEAQPSATSRRYLQCPAVVNISHLKKFLSMKFDIDSTQFAIDILYKRVPLPDYYTLMDIAYIYNWKRNEPMRFFYQIIDYIAIRNRLFDINRKGPHFPDRKPSPASTEDTNVSSPAPNLNDHGSEASSGTDSPMPSDNSSKQISDTSKKNEKPADQSKVTNNQDIGNMNKTNPSPSEDVEKSQFLNSFELTAKNSCTPIKSSPTKSNVNESIVPTACDTVSKSQTLSPKTEDTLKRKHQLSPNVHEMKKLKIEIEKAKLPPNSIPLVSNKSTDQSEKGTESIKVKDIENKTKSPQVSTSNSNITTTSSLSNLDLKQQVTVAKQQTPESPGAKRSVPGLQNTTSPKRKPVDTTTVNPTTAQKTVSPLKLQVPKIDVPSSLSKPDVQKPHIKKIPDLKPSIPLTQSPQNKGQHTNKVRMDLLANNSDPTMDRSKILSQVKSSLIQHSGQTSGDQLKSLFDSCKINIPSSLSITLTDQKQDSRNPSETVNSDQKKNMINKNLAGPNGAGVHKVPSPPVHNYIEILKLPDNDPKKQNKTEVNSEAKSSVPNKPEIAGTPLKNIKSSDAPSTAKGPVPNLKPIADTKLGKQQANTAAPITFQQTFEQQLQSLQSDKKTKLPKNKTQVPKLVPATPKAFSAVNKLNSAINKSPIPTMENKSSAALDLTTPHNIQSQLSPHQTKAFETMQSIANLAKKQNLPSKGSLQTLPQSFSNMANRPMNTSSGSLRGPSGPISQMKLDKLTPGTLQTNSNVRQEISNKVNQLKPTATNTSSMSTSSYQIPSHNSPSTAQPSPRSQTRSPSSSPKLVIAEEKQINNPTEQNINQSNQITSTQLSNVNVPKTESPKPSAGPSKSGPKPLKPMTVPGKITGIRQPIIPTLKPNPTPADIQFYTTQQAFLRRQMEISWLKAHSHRQFDSYKTSNVTHQSQNEFNKDK